MRNIFGPATKLSNASIGYALGAAAALTLLAACSGGSATPPVARSASQSADGFTHALTHSFSRSFPGDGRHPEIAALPGAWEKAMQAKSQSSRVEPSRVKPNIASWKKGTVWVTDAGNNSVYRCTDVTNGCVAQQTVPFGSPSPLPWSEPQGIAAGAHDNVYIADTSNSRIVKLSRSGVLMHIYPDLGYYPVGVAVATNGTICVTNIISTSGGPGNVTCFSQTGTSIHVASGGLYNYYFCGFDSAGNLYVDGFDSNSNVVVEEIAGAAGVGTTEVASSISNVQFPGGIQVDRSNGVLDVEDQIGLVVDQYLLPGYGPATPASIPLSGSSDPVSFGFAAGDHSLWTADAGLSQANAYADPTGLSGPSLPSATSQTGLFSMPIGAVYTSYGQY